MHKISVVIPNLNGKESLKSCLASLAQQTLKIDVIVVDNASVDGSVEYIRDNFAEVIILSNPRNLGFAGGVNTGIKYSIDHDYEFIALLNNDASADKAWAEELMATMSASPKAGIVTSKIIDAEGKLIDSTGDIYTSWGLSYPRGRAEPVTEKYDSQTTIFAASGGASLYRVSMLKEIGLFDEDFFAYYEDVDISFRAQLVGWKVKLAPKAVVYHEIGATSSKIKGFTTYQTMKNYPFLVIKDVPTRLLPEVLPRFILAYFSFYVSAVNRGQIVPATKGLVLALIYTPKKLIQRYKIQSSRKVSADYISSMIVHDLPPNAAKLRKLRTSLRKLRLV